MENKNLKYYYYGFSLFFVAKIIMNIAECILYMVICRLNLSLFIIPCMIAIVCIAVIYVFLFYRSISKTIKPLTFILILIIGITLSQLYSLMFTIDSYSTSEIGLTRSLLVALNGLFMFSFGIIAYIKYWKIKE